ncbi:hypothetical protein ACHAPE_004549 [Trichoderma viride]
MASKLLCNFRVSTKFLKIFKSRKFSTKPQTEKKSASTLDSTSEVTDTSAANPSSAAKIFEPAAPISETPDLLEVSLWDRAYDNLREKDKALVEEYERLLSRELPSSNSPKNVLEYTINDESLTKTENRIKNNDHSARLTQLETITSNGLHELDKKKARYYIFGCEFVVRDQFTQATRFIQTIKEVIDDAVKTSPEASLAWAGFCVILPIFMNPSVAEEATRDGYLYVTSRIRFYVKLENLLSRGSKNSGLDIELEERLMTLYQLIIEFQIKIVRRVYLTRLKRLQEDAVRHENWKEMIAKIQESEKMFNNDFTLVKDIPMKTALEELNCNTKELFTRIDAMLGSLLNTTSCRTPTLSFENEGSGNQFNATGGIQNNATGSGMQFSKVTFTAPVTF